MLDTAYVDMIDKEDNDTDDAGLEDIQMILDSGLKIEDDDIDEEYGGTNQWLTTTGYSRPLEPHMATIFKYMAEIEITKRLGRASPLRNKAIKLWFDTMASHSVTSDLRLFGREGPSMKVNVYISSWNNGLARTKITEAGMTVFGPMLYYPSACGTIIAGYEAKSTCHLEWLNNDVAVKVRPHGCDNVVIEFDQNEVNRILESEIDEDDYSRLCNNSQARVYSAISNYNNVSDGKINSDGFQRSLVALHGHKLTCHACSSYLATSTTLGILSNMPFNARDCHNIDRITNGRCPHCAVAKSKYTTIHKPGRQTDRRNKANEVDKQKDNNLPDESTRYTANVDSSVEHLCIDHMFIDGKPFLVSVGVNFNFIHVIPMDHGRREKWVMKAIQLILDDYERNKLPVNEMSHMRLDNTKPEKKNDLSHGEETQKMIETIISDGELTFIKCALIGFKQGKNDLKIHHKNLVPGEHVSVVERTIQTIKERVMSVRVSLPYKVEGKVLAWLVGHTAMWMNVLHSKRAPMSAWKALVGSQLNYRDLSRTSFGEVVVAHQPKLVFKEGEPKGDLGISLGANPRQPGAIFFYSFSTNRIKSRLRFKTEIGLSAVETLGSNEWYIKGEHIEGSYRKYLLKKSVTEADGYFNNDVDETDVVLEGSTETEPIGPSFINASDQRIFTGKEVTEKIENIQTDETDPEAAMIGMTMALQLADAVIMTARSDITSTNISWKKAKRRADMWGYIAMEAIYKELRQIVIEYDVCTPVDKNKKINNCHLSHALYDDDKDKARLVVGKKIHEMMVDYGIETSSPTVNGKIINLMLSVCIHHGLDLQVWDVKGAFLKSPLHTPGVFVRIDAMVTAEILDMLSNECLLEPNNQQPADRHQLWLDKVRADGTMMVEVHRGWYGLPAASALWFKEISQTLVDDAGYIQSTIDRCLFSKKLDDGSHAYVMLHVDDLGVMIPPDHAEWDRLRTILEKKYEALSVKKGDRVKYIGLELVRNREKNRFEISMNDYIKNLCTLHGVNTLKCSEINPADSLHFNDVEYDGDDDMEISDAKELLLYRSLVMSMQYGNLVVPSVRYHVIYLATRQAHPKKGDYKKALRVLRYMHTMSEKAMHIYGMGKNPYIYVYTDAAFDVYRDSVSQSGKTIFIGDAGGAVYCHSNKQKCVTRSSTESEIVAAGDAMDIAQFYRMILEELGFNNTKVIHYQDNMSCISLVDSGCYAYDKKERHIVRKINFMHEYFENPENNASMVWCPTHWMIADLMTKDLHGAQFKALESICLGYEDIDLGPYDKKVVQQTVPNEENDGAVTMSNSKY